MNTVIIRNIKIGTGIPKICVPIVGATKEEILEAGCKIRETAADIVEWRGDWYADILNYDRTLETLYALREVLGDLPLLFTFRTAKEGGEQSIDVDTYVELNQQIIRSQCADLIDVELFTGEETVRQLIEAAHAHGVKVIVSNHDFQKTPDKEELLARLRRMQELGADIPKLAVMPQNKKDVLTLLSATEEMTSHYADRPVITMSMAGAGVISRLCGEVFGSALTFGAAGKTSAPGQLEVRDLHDILHILHDHL